ncbi:MAG: hypothetical protein IPM84_25935 [Anaerolineae bacterium]|nr:hypothetical protein [Anaerolineae bacterium]
MARRCWPDSQQLYESNFTNIAYDNLVLDNVISGNSVAGVVLLDSAGGNLVRGNIIGPAVGGEALLVGSVQSDAGGSAPAPVITWCSQSDQR